MTSSWGSDTESFNESEPPLLRIWGSFQDNSPPPTKLFERNDRWNRNRTVIRETQCDVKLSHHDSKDGQADLSQPRWYDALPALDQSDLELSRQKVAQSLPLRQDRLIGPDHWEPIKTTVYHEVENEHWVPVQLALYDRMCSTTKEVQLPPTTLLAQHVSSYVHARSRESPESKLVANFSLLPSDSAETRAPTPVRARKRRALQHSAAAKSDDNSVQKLSPQTPVQDTVFKLRGRMKRRLRRNRVYGRNHADNVVFTTTEDEQNRNPSSHGSGGSIEYLQRRGLPLHLLELPQIVVVESFQPVILERDRTVEYHPSDEAIIIPIKIPTCDSVVGSLLIAKAAFRTQRNAKVPWDSSIVNRARIALTKLETPLNSTPNGTSGGTSGSMEGYWQKFPVRYVPASMQRLATCSSLRPSFCHPMAYREEYSASDLYKYELSIIKTGMISHMDLAIQWSFQCPALFSPDESLDMYATEEEYCRESFLVSPDAFYSDYPPFVGSKADETMRWLSYTSESWHYQRIEWKDMNMQAIMAADDDATDAEQLAPVPPPFRRAEESHRSLRQIDHDFTRAVGVLESQNSRYGARYQEDTDSGRHSWSLSQGWRSSTESAPIVEEEVLGGTQKPPDGRDDLGVALPTERSASPSHESPSQSDSESGYYFGPRDDTIEDEHAESQLIDEARKKLKELGEGSVSVIYINHPEIFYGTRYFGLAPWWTKENHAMDLLKIMNDPEHHQELRAHALLQYSLCLFSGLGMGQDAKKGLEWFWLAAEAGSRRARAVVRRLFRSYGEEVPDEALQLRWLVKEAGDRSQWALDELQHEYNHAYKAELRKQAFEFLRMYRTKDPEELEGTFREVQPEIQSLLDRSDDQEKVSDESRAGQFMKSGGLEWATCYADAAVVSTLLRFDVAFFPLPYSTTANETIHPLLVAALAIGSVEAVHIFLDQMLINDEQPYRKNDHNPLFALHHVPDDEVVAITAKLVQLGEDVNDQVDVSTSLRNTFLLGEWEEPPSMKHWYSRREGFSITPLRWAVENHRPAVVKALLDHGAVFPRVPDAHTYVKLHPEGFDPEHATVPVLDSPCYDLEILKMFFERHGGDQHRMTVFSETPLGLIATEPDAPDRRLRIGHLARRENLFPVLDLLRTHQRGSDPELFRAAVANGHLEIVEYLLLRGVSVELRCHGLTPLHTAVLHGQTAIFDRLVEHGADVCATTTRRGISAAHLVFWKPKAAETEIYMLSELARRGADVLARDTPFGTAVSPLHLAVMGARVAAVNFLLRAGADRAMPLGEEGVMPSLAGARFTDWGIGRSERVESFHVGNEHHGRVAVPLRGLTALGILLQRWDMYTPRDFVRLLGMLCEGAGELRDFYARPDIKQTALHLASCHSTLVRAGVLEYLLERGRDMGLHINIVDCDGDTPLHYASLLGGGWERLVSLGADPGIRNAHGMTPVDLRFRGHMYQIEKDPKSFPLKSLEFEGLSSPYADRPDEESIQSRAFEQDSPCARLWDRLGKGFVFREVWDVETGEWHTLSNDVALRLRIGERGD